jgi:hypothetical protein
VPSGARQRELADRLKASGALDRIFEEIDAGEVPLGGDDGLLKGMLKAALKRGLEVELTEHVGYERGDRDAWLFPNSRNGTTPKTVSSEIGDVALLARIAPGIRLPCRRSQRKQRLRSLLPSTAARNPMFDRSLRSPGIRLPRLRFHNATGPAVADPVVMINAATASAGLPVERRGVGCCWGHLR